MPLVIFFPWMTVAEPVVIGDFQLNGFELPSVGEVMEAGLQKIPSEVPRILGAYRSGPQVPIGSVTIVTKVGDSGDENLDRDLAGVFQMAEAIAFEGLAHRTFFRPSGYMNVDTFRCIVQSFSPGTPFVVEQSRRRDGTGTHVWEMDSFTFDKPVHIVEARDRIVDTQLANRILAEMCANQKFDRAIRWFNQANTDSPSIRSEFELVALISAFQQLLDVGTKHFELSRAFERLFATVPYPTSLTSPRPKIAEQLVRGRSLRGAWIGDLYALRGHGAHGHDLREMPSAWTPDEHLLLGAFIFPLAVKLFLAGRGYALTERDRDLLLEADFLLAEASLHERSKVDLGGGAMVRYGWDIARDKADGWRLQRTIEEVARSAESNSSVSGNPHRGP